MTDQDKEFDLTTFILRLNMNQLHHLAMADELEKVRDMLDTETLDEVKEYLDGQICAEGYYGVNRKDLARNMAESEAVNDEEQLQALSEVYYADRKATQEQIEKEGQLEEEEEREDV